MLYPLSYRGKIIGELYTMLTKQVDRWLGFL